MNQPLPVRKQDEPIKGWKQATLHLDTKDGYTPHLEFQGLGSYVHPYTPISVAKCADGGSHQVPDRECGCGFWAIKDTNDLWYSSDRGWLLEVELYGRIIHYEKGYRGEKMRVLSIRPPLSCNHCAEIARYIVSAEGQVVVRCPEHLDHVTVLSREWLARELNVEIKAPFIINKLDANTFNIKINQPDIKFPDSINVGNAQNALRIPRSLKSWFQQGTGQIMFFQVTALGSHGITTMWRNMGDSLHMEMKADGMIVWQGAWTLDRPD